MELATAPEDGPLIDRARQVSPPDDRAMDPPGGPPMMSQHSGAMMAPPPGGPSPRLPGPPTMPGPPPPGGRPGGPPAGRPGGPPGGRGGRGFGGRRGFSGGRSMSASSSSTEHGTSVQMRGSTPGMPPGGPPPVSPVYVRPETPEEQASSSEDDSSDDEGATVAIEQSFVSPEDDGMEEVSMRPQHSAEQNDNAVPIEQDGSGSGQQVGAGGVGYISSDDEDPGTEFQQMQQQWLDERRDLKDKLRRRDSKLMHAEMEVIELKEALQLARDRAYAAEAEVEAAKAKPPPNEALMSMIERLQAENRDLRKEMISPSIEDEAEKLMAFSDEMDERTEEIKSLRVELDRVNAENARLVEKARNSSPPHGVAKVTAVKAIAPDVAQREPQEELPGPSTDAAHAEVMNLRKQCNKLRFQLSEANQKIVKLQEQLLAKGGMDDEVVDPRAMDMPRRDAWASFGAARNGAGDPFVRPTPLERARSHGSENDTDSESQTASPMPLGGPQRDAPDGDREEGMVGGPRAANELARFESAGRMAVGSREGIAVEPPPAMFEECGRDGVDVYIIKRAAIKYAERAKGTLETYTVTIKDSGDFVMVAVRETGLTDVVSSSSPLRFFCEDVKPACYNGISPDGSQPSYMGKLVPKSESRGKEFNLFRGKPHKVGLDKKEQEDLLSSQELHAWIKVKWKSIAKVPEPRRIKVQLHGDNSTHRMLRNFCAEKRTMTTKLAMFDSPVTSRKNFVLMWEQQPGPSISSNTRIIEDGFFTCACLAGVVGGDADNNIVELAKVGEDAFQLNVKDTLTPFQTIGIALSSITAEK